MLDRKIVGAIVAGDQAGLAAAYDRYAPSLYVYCQSLLTEPADAAGLTGHFIIAARSFPRSATGSLPALAVRGGPERVLPAASHQGQRRPTQ